MPSVSDAIKKVKGKAMPDYLGADPCGEKMPLLKRRLSILRQQVRRLEAHRDSVDLEVSRIYSRITTCIHTIARVENKSG